MRWGPRSASTGFGLEGQVKAQTGLMDGRKGKLTARKDKEDRKRFLSEALPHSDALYRMALRLAEDASVAEDFVQETFKEAWVSFHTYQPGSNCKAWLFRILFRVRGRHLSSRNKLKWVPLEDVPEKRLAVTDFRQRVEARLVLKILHTLPRHYQVVLVLADVENLSYREIAQTLGVPIGTVMSRLNRARKFFRSKLAPELEGVSQTGSE
ncbi:MAG: sigma-70 family RNA polymerase sigma factor [Acidobacteriota bacterium]